MPTAHPAPTFLKLATVPVGSPSWKNKVVHYSNSEAAPNQHVSHRMNQNGEGVKDHAFWALKETTETMTRKQSILADFLTQEVSTLRRSSSIVAAELPNRRRDSKLLDRLNAKSSVASMEIVEENSAVMRSVTHFEREIIANKDAWANGFKRRTVLVKRETEAKIKAENMRKLRRRPPTSWDRFQKVYIKPDTPLLTTWECTVVVLVLYNAFALPYRLAFDRNHDINALTTLDTLSDVFFWIDMLLNFFIAFRDPWGVLVTNRRKIAFNYLQGWFWIDFPACFPFELLSSSDDISITSALKMARLLRVSKIARVLRQKLGNYADASRMLRILGQIILACHLIGCAWYFIGDVGKAQGSRCVLFPTSRVQIAVNTGSTEHMSQFCSWLAIHGLDRPEASTSSRYLKSIYYSVTLLTSVGYGDIVPVTATECIFTALVTVVGAGIYATVFSNFVSYVSRSDLMEIKYQEKKR